MSSENQQTSNVSLGLIGIVVASIYLYEHRQEVVEALITVTLVLFGFALFGWAVYFAVKRDYLPEDISDFIADLFNIKRTPKYEPSSIVKTVEEAPETNTSTLVPVEEQPTIAQEKPAKIPEVHEEDKLLKCPLHHASELTENQITTLEHHNYILKEFVPIGKTRREPYYILEDSPRNYEHTFMVYSLIALLKPFVQSVEVRHLPDIVFYYKGLPHALSIMNPHMPHKLSRLERMSKRLTKEYGIRWWFVTIKSAYAKTFQPYGTVLTRKQIPQWIQETFKQ